MDAELYRKMAAKEDPEWDAKVLAWVEAVLEEKLPSDDLWVCLKNGVALVRVLNKIKPGLVPKYNKVRSAPAHSEPRSPLLPPPDAPGALDGDGRTSGSHRGAPPLTPRRISTSSCKGAGAWASRRTSCSPPQSCTSARI